MTAANYPLAWIGSARVDRIRDRLEKALETWARSWAIGEFDAFAVQATQVFDASAAKEAWESPSGRALILVEGGLGFLGRRLCGIGNPSGGELAAAIGTRALTDLLETLGLNQANLRPVPQGMRWGTRHGCVFFKVTSRIGDWTVGFDRSASGQLAPPAMHEAAPLADRRALIDALTAQAEIRLGLGDISVADSLSLQPGQILNTSIPIKAGITLQSVEGGVLAHGTLTASAAKKAFRMHAAHQ